MKCQCGRYAKGLLVPVQCDRCVMQYGTAPFYCLNCRGANSYCRAQACLCVCGRFQCGLPVCPHFDRNFVCLNIIHHCQQRGQCRVTESVVRRFSDSQARSVSRTVR
jgi:hypothetical protein